MMTKIKFIILRIGLILTSLGLIVIGVGRFGDIAIGAPILIIIGILLLVVVMVRWKDLEKIGK